MTDYLNEVKLCPKCKKEVLWGDMIWLDGECLCPQCYQNKLKRITSASASKGGTA